MKIETLTISGLRSHRAGTTVTLDDKKLVAVVGPTGAGKSSLLEAVCFALYGEATYAASAYSDLSSDGRSVIDVRMTFTLGAKRYQLVRTVKPTRQGGFVRGDVWIREVDADGTVLSHVDGRRDVDRTIAGLLGGITREQFCQAVLLAQNRYAQLLEASEGDRAKLLDILLGLTALDNARKATGHIVRVAAEQLHRLTGVRAQLPDDPAAVALAANGRADALTALAAQADTAASSLTELAAARGVALDAAERLEAASRLAVGNSDVHARLATLADNLDTAIAAEATLTAGIVAARAALEQARTAEAAAQTAHDAAVAEHGSGDSHIATGSAFEQLERLTGELPGLVADAAALSEAVDGHSARVATLTRDAAEAADVCAHARDAQTATAADAQRARQAADRATTAIAAVRAAASRLTATAAVLADTGDIAADAAAVTGLAGELAAAEEARRAAADALDNARRQDLIADIAHDCSAGDPCPVCHTALPDDFHAPAGGDLADAHAKLEAADTAVTAARDRHTRADRQLGASLAVLARAATDTAAAATVLADTTAAAPPNSQTDQTGLGDLNLPDLNLPDIPGPDGAEDAWTQSAGTARRLIDVVDDWSAGLDAHLVPLSDAAETAETAAGNAAERYRATEAARAALSGELAEATAHHGAADAAAEGARRAVDAAHGRIDATAATIPERWRAALGDPIAALDRARQLLADDRAALAAADTALTSASDTHSRAADTVRQLDERWRSDVTGPRDRAVSTLEDLTATVDVLAAAHDVTMPDVQLLDAADTTCAELREHVDLLATAARNAATAARDAADVERRRAGELDGPAAERLEELRAALTGADSATFAIVLDALAAPGDALAAERIAAVQRLAGSAQSDARNAAGAAAAAQSQIAQAATLDGRIADVEAWKADLDAAAAILTKDQFPAWARQQRVAELVAGASQLLGHMTGGRYRFDEHLQIVDETTGATRRPVTLSGGEKFEAALSLALSVSEIAARGGVRFDTLFLDEGFAGLDHHNLNRALDALERQVDAGRCIVIITHIGAVADRIRDVLLVEPDGMGGSSTRWLDDEERSELGADLDLATA